MYSQGLHAQALHEAMAEAIAAIVERQPQRRWRLLELGAGTAAASRTVIARLAPLVQRGAEVDYLFTDVSSYFLAAARERFADQPWVRFGRFDMNGDLLDQGVAPHSVDILLSSGALNNALDTPALLAGLRELLSADAWLVIQELTREHNEISVSQSLMMENPRDLRDERRQLFVHTGQWLEWLAAQGGDLACGWCRRAALSTCLATMSCWLAARPTAPAWSRPSCWPSSKRGCRATCSRRSCACSNAYRSPATARSTARP